MGLNEGVDPNSVSLSFLIKAFLNNFPWAHLDPHSAGWRAQQHPSTGELWDSSSINGVHFPTTAPTVIKAIFHFLNILSQAWKRYVLESH